MTIGLSDWLLHDPSRHVPARQELMFCRWSRVQPKNPGVPLLLGMLARAAVAAEKTWPVGRTIVAGGPLFDNSQFSGLFATNGSYLPREIVFVDATEPPTEVSMLIPIHPTEAEDIRRLGWPAFQDLIEKLDPDLLDLSRPPMVIDET